MIDAESTGEAKRGATMAQLKADIDSGLTGDKVAGFDPGASPLGTDDEAAGVSPPPEVVALERVLERAQRPSATANAATPELAPDGHLGPQRGLWLAVLAGVAAGAMLGVLIVAAL
jgi:hypothetical protein